VYHSLDLLNAFFSFQFNIDLETKIRKFMIHEYNYKTKKAYATLWIFQKENVRALSQNAF